MKWKIILVLLTRNSQSVNFRMTQAKQWMTKAELVLIIGSKGNYSYYLNNLSPSIYVYTKSIPKWDAFFVD